LPGEACTAPLPLYDTSAPTAVIGSGTAASCREEDLRTAVAAGGTITFDCGADPATIQITQTLELRVDRDTIHDGGGTIKASTGARS
jgi:hypothetical protein